MTSCHRGGGHKHSWRPPLPSVITTLYYIAVLSMGQSLMLVMLFFHRRVWYRVLSLHNVCNRRSGIILIHVGYVCAKFYFFHDLHCWANPWEKIAYSITHSVIDPAYLMPRGNKELVLRHIIITHRFVRLTMSARLNLRQHVTVSAILT